MLHIKLPHSANGLVTGYETTAERLWITLTTIIISQPLISISFGTFKKHVAGTKVAVDADMKRAVTW
jgi:hypothetical protein